MRVERAKRCKERLPDPTPDPTPVPIAATTPALLAWFAAHCHPDTPCTPSKAACSLRHTASFTPLTSLPVQHFEHPYKALPARCLTKPRAGRQRSRCPCNKQEAHTSSSRCCCKWRHRRNPAGPQPYPFACRPRSPRSGASSARPSSRDSPAQAQTWHSGVARARQRPLHKHRHGTRVATARVLGAQVAVTAQSSASEHIMRASLCLAAGSQVAAPTRAQVQVRVAQLRVSNQHLQLGPVPLRAADMKPGRTTDEHPGMHHSGSTQPRAPSTVPLRAARTFQKTRATLAAVGYPVRTWRVPDRL
jgi:hypothetical protein